ncbi:MAG: FGGY-family carbohydrate kinase [Terriglobia bacterium]
MNSTSNFLAADLGASSGRVFVGCVRIVGGGCVNRSLCQFTSDATRRVVVSGPVEAWALGNIVVQAIATGQLSDIAQGREATAASVQQSVFEPRPNDAWEEIIVFNPSRVEVSGFVSDGRRKESLSSLCSGL